MEEIIEYHGDPLNVINSYALIYGTPGGVRTIVLLYVYQCEKSIISHKVHVKKGGDKKWM